MLSLRRRTIAILTSLSVVGGTMFGAAHVAQATTGPTYSRPATFKVNSKFAQQFVGQYLLKSLPAAARVQSAALGIEVGSNGFLYGIGQFYGYDKSGSQTSWVFQLYHFHQLGKGNMMIDLLSPTLTVLLGHLYVGAPVHNNISGLLELNNHRYPVVFHRITTR
ncbi:MAG: hypothetical protein JWO42_3577 [Chloroflexi bacterium]|jgi:hypothetical protein|nr:hypothetical protein [Chloroflexota bacterium]